MGFRPYPVLSVAILPVLAFLLALGVWQLNRADEKRVALAAFDAARDRGEMSLAEAFCGEAPADGARAQTPGLRSEGGRVRVYGRDAEGAPGWRVFAEVAAPACLRASTVLAEIGFTPLNQDQIRPLTDPRRYERPMRRGPFTPASDPSTNTFYAFDRAGMAGALNLMEEELYAELWLARDDGAPPAHLAQTPPARHLGYAVTWFTMAIALMGVYIAFHAARGRLRLRR